MIVSFYRPTEKNTNITLLLSFITFIHLTFNLFITFIVYTLCSQIISHYLLSHSLTKLVSQPSRPHGLTPSHPHGLTPAVTRPIVHSSQFQALAVTPPSRALAPNPKSSSSVTDPGIQLQCSPSTSDSFFSSKDLFNFPFFNSNFVIIFTEAEKINNVNMLFNLL